MAKSVYTEELVAALRLQNPLTYEKAVAFAEENGLKVRSVIAKAKSMEMEYVPKPVVAKNGDPIERKGEIISEIESALKVAAGSLSGLSKSTKEALKVLREAVDA